MASPTLVIETGTGSSTANTYRSVTDAEGFLEANKEYETFKGLKPDEKIYALISSTRYLEMHFRYYGDPFLKTQALQFPRTKNFDNKGLSIAAGTIPPP